jgi:hypothetical protein
MPLDVDSLDPDRFGVLWEWRKAASQHVRRDEGISGERAFQGGAFLRSHDVEQHASRLRGHTIRSERA